MLKQALALVGLTLSLTANAASITYSEEGVVTAIGALDIGGITYNVDFNEPAEYDTYGGDYEYFNGDDNGALAALLAINAALSQEGNVSLNSEGDGFSSAIYIVYNAAGAGSLGGIFGGESGGENWGETTIEYDGQNRVAFSQVSEVPIPAAAWLFGSALIGLVGKKRLSRRPVY
jgi:hypothetical protein